MRQIMYISLVHYYILPIRRETFINVIPVAKGEKIYEDIANKKTKQLKNIYSPNKMSARNKENIQSHTVLYT